MSTGCASATAPNGPDAVAGIEFEAREGQIFGLLGPNGAGKTTTIGAITTRVRPSAGHVTIDGSTSTAAPSRSSAGSRSYRR